MAITSAVNNAVNRHRSRVNALGGGTALVHTAKNTALKFLLRVSTSSPHPHGSIPSPTVELNDELKKYIIPTSYPKLR